MKYINREKAGKYIKENITDRKFKYIRVPRPPDMMSFFFSVMAAYWETSI